jgi:hypothetical protein
MIDSITQFLRGRQAQSSVTPPAATTPAAVRVVAAVEGMPEVDSPPAYVFDANGHAILDFGASFSEVRERLPQEQVGNARFFWIDGNVVRDEESMLAEGIDDVGGEGPEEWELTLVAVEVTGAQWKAGDQYGEPVARVTVEGNSARPHERIDASLVWSVLRDAVNTAGPLQGAAPPKTTP